MISTQLYQIPSLLPFAKPKALEFRPDGILYNGNFIQNNEFEKIYYWSIRKAYPNIIYTSYIYSYYIKIEGGNKKISFCFQEKGKNTEKKKLYHNVTKQILNTAGVHIIDTILNSINAGVDYKIGRSTFTQQGIICNNSNVIAAAVYFSEISIKGRAVLVPYERATCSYDSGMICVSDNLHTKLDCRIDPQTVANSVLIPYLINIIQSR